MTASEKTSEGFKVIEWAGVLGTYLTLLISAPEWIEKTGFNNNFSPAIKHRLLLIHSSKMLWLSLEFTLFFILVLASLIFIWKATKKLLSSKQSKAFLTLIITFRWIWVICSLGLSTLGERMKRQQGVKDVEIIKRPTSWPKEPHKYNEVIRLHLSNNEAINIELPKDFRGLKVRETVKGSSSFGYESFQKPGFKRSVLLICFSNKFIAWVIAYCLCSFFRKVRQVIVS